MDMMTILLLDTVKLHEKPSINIGLHLSISHWNSLLEKLHNRHCCVGIQPSSGFIKKKNLWLSDQLQPNVSPLPLPPRNTTNEFCTNL